MPPQPHPRGLQPVKLADVPFQTRAAAARRVCRELGDSKEQFSVLAAALAPSERTYWVSRRAASLFAR